VGILEYLNRHEPNNLKRVSGDTWQLKDHDSLKISNGKFHWFSRGIGGSNALDYLVKVRGIDFKEAVAELSSEVGGHIRDFDKKEEYTPKKIAEKKPFILPPPNAHNENVIAYLQKRGIDKDIIDECIEKNTLYEDEKQACVFVGYDGQTPKYAAKRSTRSDFKGDVANSSKIFNFCLTAKKEESEHLCVFESPIDAMSHATIAKKLGKDNEDTHRLSLGGLSSLGLKEFLVKNPKIKNIYFCFDNDMAGEKAMERISSDIILDESLKNREFKLIIWQPKQGKDYNEMLINMIKDERELAREVTKESVKEAVKEAEKELETKNKTLSTLTKKKQQHSI